MSGLSDWFWAGVLSLPFALIGSLLYGVLIKSLGSEDKLARLSSSVTKDECQQIVSILVCLLGCLFLLAVGPELQYLLHPTWPQAVWGKILAAVGLVMAATFLIVTVFYGAYMVMMPVMLYAFRRRIDLVFYILFVFGFYWLLTPYAMGPSHYLVYLICGLILSGYALILLRIPLFLLGALWSWLTKELEGTNSQPSSRAQSANSPAKSSSLTTMTSQSSVDEGKRQDRATGS